MAGTVASHSTAGFSLCIVCFPSACVDLAQSKDMHVGLTGDSEWAGYLSLCVSPMIDWCIPRLAP